MRRIIVTGATGFIGSHVVARLARENDIEVIALSRNGGDVAGGSTECVDLCNGAAVRAWSARRFATDRLDAIFHLAASVPARFDGDAATSSYEANMSMTNHVVDLAAEQRCPVIYASSTSVYGSHFVPPATEDGPVNPENPYALSKLEGEQLLADASLHRNITTASLRIAAPYGPGQRFRTVLSIFVDAAVNGRDLIVHGSGKRTQDFTHVSDVADAFWLAFERRASGAYNVSGGNPVTMARLAELAVASSSSHGSRIRVGEAPDPQDDYRGVFSIDRARRDFGFEPRVSLQEGLTRSAAMIAAPT